MHDLWWNGFSGEWVDMAKVKGFYKDLVKGLNIIEFDDGFKMFTSQESLTEADIKNLEFMKEMLSTDLNLLKARILKIMLKLGVNE